MLKKYMYCFTAVLFIGIIFLGITRVDINLYKLVCMDNNKSKVAEDINKDKTYIKIFSGISPNSELYNLLNDSKSKSIMVFYETNPLYISVESGVYRLYYNENVNEKYKSHFTNLEAFIKYEYSSMINNVRDSISKITSKISSY